jgi:hypothetical protein
VEPVVVPDEAKIVSKDEPLEKPAQTASEDSKTTPKKEPITISE